MRCRGPRLISELFLSPQDPNDAFDPEAQVGHLLRRAYARAKKNSTVMLRASGEISPIQAVAVAALSAGDLSQAELGRRIEMEPANVHGFIRRLQASGLVLVGRDEAMSKTSRVGLTPKGRQIADGLLPLARQSAEQTLKDLTHEERQTFIRLLRKVAESA